MAGDIEAVEKGGLDLPRRALRGRHGQAPGQAFHEVSHLYGLRDGGVDDMPREKWFDLVNSRPSPKARGLSRTDRIVSVDFSGPETAFVSWNAPFTRAISPTTSRCSGWKDGLGGSCPRPLDRTEA